MVDSVLVIHTDGACHGNPGPGGWGAFWQSPASGTVELLGGARQTTNNRMEIEAVLRALVWVQAHHRAGKILVRTDSQYVIKGLTEWRAGWERRKWRTAGGDAVKNADLWRVLFPLYDALKPRLAFEWVRGHNGDPGNERADRLALEGLQWAGQRPGGPWVRQAGAVSAWALPIPGLD